MVAQLARDPSPYTVQGITTLPPALVVTSTWASRLTIGSVCVVVRAAFYNASSFNGDLSAWSTGKVTTLASSASTFPTRRAPCISVLRCVGRGVTWWHACGLDAYAQLQGRLSFGDMGLAA